MLFAKLLAAEVVSTPNHFSFGNLSFTEIFILIALA